jgi:DNA polymerase IV
MRSILHCDLNGFFASVECLKRPELKNVPMAVCGDPKKRSGIILAKNELAKKYGVITTETIYSAVKKCKNLVLVQGNYEDYYKYSKLVQNIYLKYTDRVEEFGIDECWLDVTESLKLFGSAKDIAYKIKEEVKKTLDLTISVGVSFNKTLAKLR